MKTPPTREQVILLDSFGNPCGVMEKSRVHTMNTPLHSAFSVFLFTSDGLMLTQQRAHSKKTWPGIWSNACCGHPAPGETHTDAARRRLKEELGIINIELTMALPEFQYQATHQGIMENEVCPVMIGFCEQDIELTLNSAEVENIQWVSSDAFFQACEHPKGTAFEGFSPWSLIEGRQLKCLSWFKALLRKPA